MAGDAEFHFGTGFRVTENFQLCTHFPGSFANTRQAALFCFPGSHPISGDPTPIVAHEHPQLLAAVFDFNLNFARAGVMKCVRQSFTSD
jgi:hypothetical protein